MRTSTMKAVNNPVSANWAASQCSKSVFMSALELDDRRGRHEALIHLQKRLAALGLVPRLEGAEGGNRISERRLLCRRRTRPVSIGRCRMRLGMHCLGDRSQPIEQ